MEKKKEFKAPVVEHIQFEENNVIETSGNGRYFYDYRGNPIDRNGDHNKKLR